MKTIRWGILGCGRIAKKFAADLAYVEGATLIAVASRSMENARAFAAEFPAPFVLDSYEALVGNPEVDVIYIATPHAQHHEHTLLCLRHNKAVLCEKAFALNHGQALEMINLAKKRGIFLMEALWTKFLPHFRVLEDQIAAGRLGEIRSLLVNFGFVPAAPVPQRLFDPALGGGTMLDIGIYNVFLALSVLGRPDVVEASMTPAGTGVDAQCAVLFKYKTGILAQLFSTFSSNLATEADISGTRGRLRLGHRFYEPSATIEYFPGRPDSGEILPVTKEPGSGYQYEARHVCECLRKGLTESPVMSFGDTLLLMETLDRVRAAAGIHYTADDL